MLSKLTKSKRFIAVAVTVIIASSTLFWITTANGNFISSFISDDEEAKYRQNSLSPDQDNNDIGKDYYLRGGAALNETAYAEGKQLSVKNERYLCGTPFASSTQYIEEYYIPLTCSQPVGITVDRDDKIWFVATWSGYLVVFDPDLRQFVDFIEIPGKLWNITVISDKEIFYLGNDNLTHNTSYNSPYTIEMEVKPIKGITPGNYTLTVGARYDTVSYSKIIDLIVTK